MEYAIDHLGNVAYYLYDRNGNLKRKLASASFPVFASSSLEDWETYKLGDNNGGTVWSSEAQGTENDVQWIALDGGHPQIYGGITLTPRARSSFSLVFKIQSSNDAVTWTDISEQSYSNYGNDGSPHTFTFKKPVMARYIRVYATKLGRDDRGGYYFQLADVKVHFSTIATSSSLEGWEAAKLIDGNPGTGWSSNGHPGETGTEWKAIDLETAQNIGGVHITPRATLSFPKDFKIQSSNDALTWTDIPGQSYSNYINNGSVQFFNFQTPVKARYLRVYATKLGRDDRGGYYFQLNECKVILPDS